MVEKTKKLEEKYPYLVMWCSMMGSYPYYTNEQLEKANKDKAPINAIYWSKEKKRWITFNEVNNSSTLHYFEVRGLKKQ